MKKLLLLSVLVLYSCFSRAQDFAVAAYAPAGPALYATSNLSPRDSTHHSYISVGAVVFLGGAVVGVYGLTEYKNATSTSGPFTVVNQTQQNRGRLLELAGGFGIIAGIGLLFQGSASHHPHKENKISICSPGPNEIGLAYRL